ncbi:P-loop containing nucleoside triphosphate hydrolase protein [Aulographum hederae CBS 113979]|uniref:P-loop containing nucleoside triphosphate hydrolase protein n=1 Tax=Aulographum hederae CBS 113979 TaxID=1176131 RepID=A0A6G1GVV3_9PEZI|nr:P-loop containing nucleoside triphosphate hydrolase protein [Aulographum hederae CBS 113979]
MRRTNLLQYQQTLAHHARGPSSISASPPIIQIQNGTFYRQHPSDQCPTTSNPPLFPGLDFSLPSSVEKPEHWSILSNSSAARTTLLQVLRGQHLCFPPTARSYPYLGTEEIAQKDSRLRFPLHAIQYVGFDAERGGTGGSGTRGAYLSARYEARKEELDFALKDYLVGNTELNADEDLKQKPDHDLLERIIRDLNLANLMDMPVSNLSNGQTRRARIARALIGRPEILLLDGPFMGLDPVTLETLSEVLYRLASASSPRLILSLKSDDKIPEWITHLMFAESNYTVPRFGAKETVLDSLRTRFVEMVEKGPGASKSNDWVSFYDMARHLDANGYFQVLGDTNSSTSSRRVRQKTRRSMDGFVTNDAERIEAGEPLVEMEGVKIQYGEKKIVLGNWSQNVEGTEKEGLWWTIRRGERWGVFGPNGSGKTTLLSLLLADHPQSYSQPLKLFGRPRLPTPGLPPPLSMWDIQARIGLSSPELHALFPKHLSLRATLESAFAPAPLAKPSLTHLIDDKISATLRWFRRDLVGISEHTDAARNLDPNDSEWDHEFSASKKDVKDENGEVLDWRDEEMTRVSQFDMPSREGSKRGAILKAGEGRMLLRDVVRRLDAEEMHPEESVGWADDVPFGQVSFSAQRVLLFLRATIAHPDLIVLDEAFSGMDDGARERCMLWLQWGQRKVHRYVTSEREVREKALALESDISRLGRVKVEGLADRQALVVVSHRVEEVPGSVREWICLPGEVERTSPRWGRLEGPLALDPRRWDWIWGRDLAASTKKMPKLSGYGREAAFKLRSARKRKEDHGGASTAE